MPRTVPYILLTKGGPGREEQVAILKKAGVPMRATDPLYEDDLSRKRRQPDTPLPDRDLALTHLRPGDCIAVAYPGRLGFGREDVREVLRAAHLKDCSVLDASTKQVVRWTEEVDAASDFLDRAVGEHKAMAARAAREAKAKAGIKGGRPDKPFLVSEAEARRMWHDQAGHPSQKQVAEKVGKSQRALYLAFGPRGGRANRTGKRKAKQ